MPTRKLTLEDPISLTLAADSRLADLDYTNDQIWELLPGKGDPNALMLQTTYGLRARNMRIFPQFEEAHKIVRSPTDFAKPVIFTKITPNYIKLNCSPFPGIDVELEYWVPDCQTVAGRIRLGNSSEINRSVQSFLCALLSPDTSDGQPMRPTRIEVANVLHGITEKLHPVLFITGGASSVASPYPALTHSISLAPGQFRRFTWALASLTDADQSFRHARLTAAKNVDSEINHIEMLAARQIEIFTGDPDWDHAFAIGKKTALGLIHTHSQHLKHSSFISARLPDQGYSPKGSGIEYNHLWNGQSALEAWYLTQFLLPGNAEIAKGILRNFVETQEPTGFIDFKPGLAGQKSNLLAAPLLVSTAWKIYQATEDQDFLEEVFRPLFKFILAWFEGKQDRDGDGIPEWTSAIQSGFDENPTFSPWIPWAQGADSTLVEAPDLCAYLYRESQLLLKMATLLEHQEPVVSIIAIAENLHRAVQSSWNSRRATFQYWDRETHQTRKGEQLAKQTGSGKLPLDMIFELPARLLIRLESNQAHPPKVEITVSGRLSTGERGEIKLQPETVSWRQGVCTLTLPDLYAEIEQIEIKGLPGNGEMSISIIDHTLEDHTLLTPIWAGIPTPKQVDKLIQRKLSHGKSYNGEYGIPACPRSSRRVSESMCEYVWLPWNVMVGEGLLAYGNRSETVDVITRMMKGIIHNLKHEQAFRSHYHADQPKAAGQRNALLGLPPVGLFLETLGIRPLSPWKVEITNLNPFPWNVKIKYQGMFIESTAEYVNITFPDGEDVTLYHQIPCLVEHKPLKTNSDQERV